MCCDCHTGRDAVCCLSLRFSLECMQVRCASVCSPHVYRCWPVVVHVCLRRCVSVWRVCLAVSTDVGEGCPFGVQRRWMSALEGTLMPRDECAGAYGHTHPCQVCFVIGEMGFYSDVWLWTGPKDDRSSPLVQWRHHWPSPTPVIRLVHWLQRFLPKTYYVQSPTSDTVKKVGKKGKRQSLRFQSGQHIVWTLRSMYLEGGTYPSSQEPVKAAVVMLRYPPATSLEDVSNYKMYGSNKKEHFQHVEWILWNVSDVLFVYN